jgi:hypothetical protein
MVGMGGMSMPNPPVQPPIEYRFTYILQILPPPPGSGLFGTEFAPGDRVQLFDVLGLELASAATASGGPFTFDASGFGPLPAGPFTDDPTIPNLVLTYTGAPLIATTASGPLVAGEFFFDTDGPKLAPGFNFAAETTDLRVSGGATPSISYGFAPATPTPEPAAWLLLLSALPAGLSFRRRFCM